MNLTVVPSLKKVAGTLYLPLRYTFESFGTEIKWDPKARTIRFSHEGKQIAIDWRSKSLTIDGKPYPDANAIREFGGSSYISTDAIGAITGLTAEVTANQITVYSK